MTQERRGRGTPERLIDINEKTVRGLPTKEAGKTAFYFDKNLRGFGVRVSGKTKTYIAQAYARGSKTKVRVTLGRACLKPGDGGLTPKDARDRAITALGELKEGTNPNQKRKARRVSEMTLRQLFDAYKVARDADGGLRPKTLVIYQSTLTCCFSDWLDKPAAQISKEMVVERWREIANTTKSRSNEGGARAMASQAMRLLKALFNFAREEYQDEEGKPLFETNPVDKLSKAHRGWSRVPARTDIIEPGDLEAWYKAVLNLQNETTRDFLILSLFLGTRRGAALKLKWQYISFKTSIITIPATDDKTHKVVKLPMSTFVHDLLKRRYDTRGERPLSEYVFPGEKPGQHLQEPKTAVASVVRRSGVKFSPHSLRRTFATTAERLDISYAKVKQLLNHAVSGDVTLHHYVKVDVEQLREPMQTISDYFEQQIGLKPKKKVAPTATSKR